MVEYASKTLFFADEIFPFYAKKWPVVPKKKGMVL